MKNLIKIEGDPYFIAQRLKEIDDSYEVYFNLEVGKYEVHSNQQVKGSFCFRLPFEILDERTLSHALRTRIENRDKIIAEIERQNLLLEKKNLKKQVDILKEALC